MTLVERYREFIFRWFHADNGVTRIIRWKCNCGKYLGETDFKTLGQ